MVDKNEGSNNKELYALLHISPEASDEEIRRAYRQWAQVYHPDKYLNPNMKDVATENFQRVYEAYEILTDEKRRIIYDIYGMEGLNSGLELGPKLNKVDEIKEELERIRRQREQENFAAKIQSTGSIMANLSLPNFLKGDGIMRGMEMANEVQSQISKNSALVIGGNLAVNPKAGGGMASAVFRHQHSPVSSVEFMGSIGLQSLIGVQTSRHLSVHSSATLGFTLSLRDGSMNLSNTWNRQLSATSSGNIQLVLGRDSSIGVGWRTKQEKVSASGEVMIGTSSLGATASCKYRFSANSHGRIAGTFGSGGIAFQIGGGRRISKYSSFRMLYCIGAQGLIWKFELIRGGQKLVLPLLLSNYVSPAFATGAFFIPLSIYLTVKKFVAKPYYLRREKKASLENIEKTKRQVEESMTRAEKAQQLLKNVAERKKNKQLETGGLVVLKAVYATPKSLSNLDKPEDAAAFRILDVTIPLNFLVTDAGQLKLHEGVKKSGIMGFCDPSPGEPKQLLVEYAYGGNKYEVRVDDFGELLIPQDKHRV